MLVKEYTEFVVTELAVFYYAAWERECVFVEKLSWHINYIKIYKEWEYLNLVWTLKD